MGRREGATLMGQWQCVVFCLLSSGAHARRQCLGVGARREVVGTRLARLVPIVTRNVSLEGMPRGNACDRTYLYHVLVCVQVNPKPKFQTFYYFM